MKDPWEWERKAHTEPLEQLSVGRATSTRCFSVGHGAADDQLVGRPPSQPATPMPSRQSKAEPRREHGCAARGVTGRSPEPPAGGPDGGQPE